MDCGINIEKGGFELPCLVSFVIPHKGRFELLKETLLSILNQDFDLQKIEIIIVTQEPRLDFTDMDKRGGELKIIYCSPQETIAALRNKGAAIAQGECFAFIDADIRLSSNWLKMILEELQAKDNRVLVSAAVTSQTGASPVEKIWAQLEHRNIDCTVDSLHARNLFLLKEIFRQAKGFPEQLKTCEDIYFTNKLSKRGEVYVTSRTTYEHLGEDKTYRDLFTKEIWRSQSNFKSLRKRKIHLQEWPSILLPIWELISFLLFLSIFCIILPPSFVMLSGAKHLAIDSSAFGLRMTILLGGIVLFFLPIMIYTLQLYLSNKNDLRLVDIFWFYTIYCTARTIGSFKGLLKL